MQRPHHKQHAIAIGKKDWIRQSFPYSATLYLSCDVRPPLARIVPGRSMRETAVKAKLLDISLSVFRIGLILLSCALPFGTLAAQGANEVTVAAAADLDGPLHEIGAPFQKQTGTLSTKAKVAAQQFMQYLKAPKAGAVLKKYVFMRMIDEHHGGTKRNPK